MPSSNNNASFSPVNLNNQGVPVLVLTNKGVFVDDLRGFDHVGQVVLDNPHLVKEALGLLSAMGGWATTAYQGGALNLRRARNAERHLDKCVESLGWWVLLAEAAVNTRRAFAFTPGPRHDAYLASMADPAAPQAPEARFVRAWLRLARWMVEETPILRALILFTHQLSLLPEDDYLGRCAGRETLEVLRYLLREGGGPAPLMKEVDLELARYDLSLDHALRRGFEDADALENHLAGLRAGRGGLPLDWWLTGAGVFPSEY